MDSVTSAPPYSSRAQAIALVLTSCVIGVLLIYLVLTRSFAFGSQLGNWVYPFLPSPATIPAWKVLVILLLLGLLVFLGAKFIHISERITLLVLFLAAIPLQSLVRSIYPVSLGSIVQSARANSFYSPAMSYSVVEILSRFNSLIATFQRHARTNMPGKILLFEFFRIFTSSPEAMGLLVIIVSTLGALVLYGTCKRLFHDRQIAFFAFILYLVIPSKLVFFPVLNTVTPVFMLLCFYLFAVYLDNKRALIAGLLGISFFVLVLFEPSPLITGIVMIGLAIHAIINKKLAGREIYRLLLVAALSFLGMSLLFYLLFSFNLFQTLLYILGLARQFNAQDGRGYLIWTVENSREFLYDAGVPVMIIFIYMALLAFVEKTRLNRWPLENFYVISLLAGFLCLVFLGINRGEVTRLWIYMAALFQVPAAIFIARIGKGSILLFLVASVLVAQSMVALSQVGFVLP